MSTLPSTPRASPSRPSRPHPRPIVTAPTHPHVKDEDLEITALTKKISALQEKKAREEEEQRRREEEEKKVREVMERMRQEELEQAKVVEARWRAVEIAKEQGVGRKGPPNPATEG